MRVFNKNKIWSYSHYQGQDDSEFAIHFYLKHVYFPSELKIEEFLNYVRDRVNRAGKMNLMLKDLLNLSESYITKRRLKK